KAIVDGGGPAGILLCRMDQPETLHGGFSSPALSPAAGSDTQSAISNASECTPHEFAGPDAGSQYGDEYNDVVTENVPDGWHGWFALAYTPNGVLDPSTLKVVPCSKPVG